MVSFPHTDKERCNCLRCEPRFILNYVAVANDQPCIVFAQFSIKAGELIADLLKAGIEAGADAPVSESDLAQLKNLEAMFRRQLPFGQAVQAAPSSGEAGE